MNALSDNGLVKPKHTNTSLHQELNKRFQKKGLCDSCGSDEGTAYALIHGREYSLNRKDYMELCRFCHNSYDHHTSDRILCSCESRSKRYQHGRAYELLDRDDAILRTCAYSSCEVSFYTCRPSKLYCSRVCKLYAFREKHGIVTRQEPHHSVCQRQDCNKEIPKDRKATTKYCSNACRQKVYHDKNKEKAKEKRDLISQKKRDEKAVDDFIKELMGE